MDEAEARRTGLKIVTGCDDGGSLTERSEMVTRDTGNERAEERKPKAPAYMPPPAQEAALEPGTNAAGELVPFDPEGDVALLVARLEDIEARIRASFGMAKVHTTLDRIDALLGGKK